MNRSGALARARDRAKKAVSPRYRRWHTTVDSLRFDPDDPEAVVEDLDPADFLICRPPRSGTALATAALFRPPEIVTVMEPWDALRMAPHDVVESVRRELRSTGALARGRLDMAALSVGRVGWRSDRETTTLVRTSPSTRIGIKLPGYWRYLPLMPETKFVVCLPRSLRGSGVVPQALGSDQPRPRVRGRTVREDEPGAIGRDQRPRDAPRPVLGVHALADCAKPRAVERFRPQI